MARTSAGVFANAMASGCWSARRFQAWRARSQPGSVGPRTGAETVDRSGATSRGVAVVMCESFRAGGMRWSHGVPSLPFGETPIRCVTHNGALLALLHSPHERRAPSLARPRGRRRGAELHPRGGTAAPGAAGSELTDPAARGAHRGLPAHAHHAQGRADARG